MNAARHNHLRDRLRLDPHVMRLVQQANELDLALYEYVKNVVYPGQQQRYYEGIAMSSRGAAAHSTTPTGVAYTVGGLYRHLVYRPVVRAYRWKHRG